MFLTAIPAALSLLMLAAHFFRAASDPELELSNPLQRMLLLAVVAICLATNGLLFIPRSWAKRLAQAILILGSLEWMRSLFFLVGERSANGQPWTRLVIILGSVAGFTLLSAILLEARRSRPRAS